MAQQKHDFEVTSGPVPPPRDDGWMITPRAITTVATIITILYSLHAPVRYVLSLANSVDVLSTRVAALEAVIAHQEERAEAAELRAIEAAAHRDAARR
jgi:hypothetical protein